MISPNDFVLVTVLVLVAASCPNLLDVELVVVQIVVDIAVDGALQRRSGVGMVFTDRTDGLDGEGAVTLAILHPGWSIDAEVNAIRVDLCHSERAVGLDAELLVSGAGLVLVSASVELFVKPHPPRLAWLTPACRQVSEHSSLSFHHLFRRSFLRFEVGQSNLLHNFVSVL